MLLLLRTSPRAAPARRAALLVAIVFAAFVLFGLADGVGAAPVPGTVSATPTTGLTDGQIVRIHAEVQTGVDLYEIRARVCRGGVAITNTFEYSADYDDCPSVALSPSAQSEASLGLEPGVRSGDLELQVGTGSVQWHNLDGAPAALTCGRDDPCQLVVQLQVTNDTVFWSSSLTYSSSTPRDPPTPPSTRPLPDEDGHPLPARATASTSALPMSRADGAPPVATEPKPHSASATDSNRVGDAADLAGGSDRLMASSTESRTVPWAAGAAIVLAGTVGVVLVGRLRRRRR